MQIAERIRSNIEQNCGRGIREVEGLRVTASFGISATSFGSKTLTELIGQADQALYGAKRTGRNRLVSICTFLSHDAPAVKDKLA